MAKTPKKRVTKYDKPLVITGTFADVVKVSVQPGKAKEQPVKPVKKKKK